MLAIDHGYFQGPTTGLERVDINILPLVPYADTLMLTRGILRSIVPPSTSKAIVLRVSGGASILKELSNEDIAVDIEESIRLNVCAMAVQVFIGGEYEKESIINMTRMVDIGNRYGIPTLAVTAVGKDMARDAKYFQLACRICAELGAHYIKTYYVEKDFDTVTASCPVPIVMAGGKKIPELDALTMAYNAVQQERPGWTWGAISSSRRARCHDTGGGRCRPPEHDTGRRLRALQEPEGQRLSLQLFPTRDRY
jgi:putative autoinducer-2 (AI-2) aldolase